MGFKERRRSHGIVRLLFVTLAVFLFSTLFFAVKLGRTARFDHDITVRIQQQKAPWFSKLMHLVSWAGFPPQSRTIPWLIPSVLFFLGHPFEAFFQFMGWGTGFFSFLIKRAMRRPRPNHPAINVAAARIGGSSFPSGHVINYIGVYGFLFYLVSTYVKPGFVRKPVLAILGGMIALVGPSRIYLGHHWLTDVLASYLLGFSYLVGLTTVYERLKWRSRRG